MEKLSNKEYTDKKLSGDDVFNDELSRDEFSGQVFFSYNQK
jgi:hypothetical protein